VIARLVKRAAAVVLLAVVCAAAVCEDAAARIARLREALSALRFEEVLTDSATFLDEDGHAAADRAQVWAIRSEAHVAVGDLKGAERDFEQVLRLQPSWRPDPSRITKKARERFEKLRAETVGTLRLTIEPAGAGVSLAGDPAVLLAPDDTGAYPVLAGPAIVRVELAGYDTWEEAVEVPAGGQVEREVRLIPNSRDLVIRTRPAGVRVRLDGIDAGVSQPGAEPGVGELAVARVSIGEHALELDKACFREARRNALVRADLLDPGPQRIDVGELEPALAPIAVSGAIEGGTLSLDGDPRGGLPTEDLLACAGSRTIEVRVRDRVVFREVIEVVAGTPVRLEARPRVNVALVGVEAWPSGTQALRADSNLLGTVAVTPGRGDLADPATWRSLPLPDQTQVALAVRPSTAIASAGGWWVYSPVLDRVQALDEAPGPALVPSLTVQSLPVGVVDSVQFGRAVVVASANPAVAPGDRVVAVAGTAVDGAQMYEAAVARTPPGSAVALTLERGGERRTVEIAGRAGPRLAPAGEGSAVLRAAWAEQIALTDAARSAAALANLAVLLSAAERHAAAAELWGRVRFPERAGVADGTAAYYLGTSLAESGRDREAIEAFRRAAASTATAPDDRGLPVAPAARDRLRDLGVR